MTIVEFLTARLDEAEARANAMEHFTVPEQPYYSCAGSRTEPHGDLDWGEDKCDCFLAERKARVLRRIESDRAILADHRGLLFKAGDAKPCACQVCGIAAPQFSRDMGACRTVLFLAAVWSDHPDYDPVWTPASSVQAVQGP